MHHDPLIPRVSICLQKIRAYLEGEYDDKADVILCLDAMETMFEYHKISNFKHEEGLCKNGHLEEPGGGSG